MAKVKRQIEDWFNISMDTLTGIFKRSYARPLTFIMATIIVCFLNIDSISFIKVLYSGSNESQKLKAVNLDTKTDSTLLNRVEMLRLNSKKDSAIIDLIKDQIESEMISNNKHSAEKIAQVDTDNSFSIGWHEDQIKEGTHFSTSKITQKA
jgi:hypothetical protein